MFREQIKRTCLNVFIRLLTFSIYAYIVLQIMEFKCSGCNGKKLRVERSEITRYFDLALHPIIWLTIISDVFLQGDRDIIQGFSKVDNLVIVSTYQREKSVKHQKARNSGSKATSRNDRMSVERTALDINLSIDETWGRTDSVNSD